MSIVLTVVRRGCRALATLAAICGIAFPTAPFAGAPNVTEIVVRFRDAAPVDDPAAPPSAAQLDALNRSLRTGIAASTATLDGGFRVMLAPSLPFIAAREAVNRLRMDADVLYASIGATDAPPSTRAVSDKKLDRSPLLQRIIVRYRDADLAADAAVDRPLRPLQLDALAQVAGQPIAHERAMTWASAYLLRLFQPLPEDQVEAIARRIAQQPDVLWAQPDYIDTIKLVPNDPSYVSQWHYFEPAGGIGLPNAWNRSTGWSGVRVAVVDTGALFGHPDVGSRFVGGYDFVIAAGPIDPNDGDNRDPDASDPGDWITANQCDPFLGNPPQNSSWHGTHVAGTIGASSNNGVGVAGVNFVSRVVPVRVLGRCGGSTSDIADGIVWASGGTFFGAPPNPYPARVVNLSLGGRRSNQLCDAAYQAAVNDALTRNVVVVVAAGNSGEETSFATPANCNGVVTVAAVGRAGQRATYSNFDNNDGTGIQVEIAAPGGSFADGEPGVLSTLNAGTQAPAANTYVQYQGTSMATPHVSGVVSLMLSLKPSLSPAQALSILSSTARAFPTGTVRNCTSNLASVTSTVKYCGAGIVDTDAALASIVTTGNDGGPMIGSSTTVQSSANPVVSGSPVTFTAQVTGSAPTGTVAFMDDETAIAGCASVALNGSGTAVCTTSALPPASHPVRAVFTPGNNVNTPSDSPTIVQVVNPGGPQPTTTQLATSPNPAAQNAAVTLTATITGFNPGGTTQFRSNGAGIGGCSAVAVTGSGNIRTAACTTTTLAAGTLAIEAIYGGDAFNLTSTGTLAQGVYGPNACAVFNDVPQSDPFCVNVQWLFNRGVTLGCAPASYCQGDAVSRLAMAAFMNREGTALTPFDLPVATTNLANVDVSSPVIACQTADQSIGGYPRRASMRARSNLWGPSGAMDVSVEHVYSTNAGSVWNAVAGSMTFQSLYSGATPADEKTTVPYGEMDLAVGQTYRFALRIARVAGAGTLVGVYCANFVQLRNRNAGTPPL